MEARGGDMLVWGEEAAAGVEHGGADGGSGD